MESRTQTTLVAVFRNNSDAQAAADDLRANGFADDDMYISSVDESKTSTQYHEGKKKNWFMSLFSHDDSKDQSSYDTAIRAGHTVVSVQANEKNLDAAVDILNSHSPVNVHSDTAGTTTTARTATAGATTSTASSAAAPASGQTGSRSIPVVREELRVGKRPVMRGGVRVYTRVVEQPVEENIRLREEKVNVERQPVNRPVNQGDLNQANLKGRDEVIEVQEFAEEPVVAKDARIVEEVRVNKQASERNETVRDTVRHTEVNVENLKPGEMRTGQAAVPEDEFRQEFKRTHGDSGLLYEDYAPAYRYGYEMASSPKYRGRDFSQIESDLRADYGRRYPNNTWDNVKDSVRYGWNKVTGRAHSASAAR